MLSVQYSSKKGSSPSASWRKGMNLYPENNISTFYIPLFNWSSVLLFISFYIHLLVCSSVLFRNYP
jgi:hypothetical protein